MEVYKYLVAGICWHTCSGIGALAGKPSCTARGFNLSDAASDRRTVEYINYF